MNANIERLITRIIEGSETLKAEKTCVEKDTEAVNDFAWNVKGGFNGVSIQLSAFNPDASEWQVCDADPLYIMD